jgi:hypothetical protein
MKQQWIFVGAGVALSSLCFADAWEESCCLPAPCYEPEPCINCQCYLPVYQPVQGCDTFVFVDVLYWFAKEKNFYYSVDGTMVSVGNQANPEVFFFSYAPDKYKTFKTKWAPGVRVGAGWSSGCNDWDVGIDWTYYHNEKKNRASTAPFGFVSVSSPSILAMPAPGQSALINPWVNQVALAPISSSNPSTTRLVVFPRVHAKWELLLNSIDLDIGRTFWVRECFTFRPYMGVRGAWIKTHFETKSEYINTQSGSVGATPIETAVDVTARDRFIDHLWGVGAHLGIEPMWMFCDAWAIFGDFNIALICGQSHSKKKEKYQGSILTTPITSAPNGFVNYHHHSSREFFSMQPIFDLRLGIQWKQSWCCDQYHTEIDLSWEQHIWPESHFRINNFGWNTQTDNIAISGQQIEVNPLGFEGQVSTLIYGGPVLRVRFDF